jgi:hypothetical protein
MIAQAAARSISRQVKTWLGQGRSITRTASVSKSACNLVIDGDGVIALVTPRIGDGPFNVVLDGPIAFDATINSGARATSTPDRLIIDHLEIDLGKAIVWEPRPAWPELRARWITCSPVLSYTEPSCIERLHILCAFYARHSVFFPLLGICPKAGTGTSAGPGMPGNALGKIARDRAQAALGDLYAGWYGDRDRLREGAVAFAGLGGGLTPAGDDFLAGLMLWAWLVHPAPGTFCRSLAEAAMPLTTTLSAAFLRAAARGQCSAAWHTLLAALGTGTPLDDAVQRILAHGATSGADALLGFLSFSDHSMRNDT